MDAISHAPWKLSIRATFSTFFRSVLAEPASSAGLPSLCSLPSSVSLTFPAAGVLYSPGSNPDWGIPSLTRIALSPFERRNTFRTDSGR